MLRKRTSVIWKLPHNEFETLIKQSNSLADILRYFDLHVGAGNYPTLKKRIQEEQIDVSHIKLGINSNKGRKFCRLKKPLEEILVEGSLTKGTSLKTRLINEKLLENICAICGLKPEWQSKPLTLTIDHINGKSSDNRIFNLRLLCPNCHSQTITFSGRNMKNKRQDKHCAECNVKITCESKWCRACASKYKKHSPKYKIEWPADEELITMINAKNFTKVAKILGISANAIKKRLKRKNKLKFVK